MISLYLLQLHCLSMIWMVDSCYISWWIDKRRLANYGYRYEHTTESLLWHLFGSSFFTLSKIIHQLLVHEKRIMIPHPYERNKQCGAAVRHGESGAFQWRRHPL